MTRTAVETYLPVRVGYSGTKVHDLHITAKWDDRKGTPVYYSGQTYCGSQRGMSGWYAIDPETPPTCLKCAKRRPAGKAAGVDTERIQSWDDTRMIFRADPTTVVEGRGQRLVLTDATVELVTIGPEEPCRDRDIDWTTRTETRCSRTGPHGAEHAYNGETRSL